MNYFQYINVLIANLKFNVMREKIEHLNGVLPSAATLLVNILFVASFSNLKRERFRF